MYQDTVYPAPVRSPDIGKDLVADAERLFPFNSQHPYSPQICLRIRFVRVADIQGIDIPDKAPNPLLIIVGQEDRFQAGLMNRLKEPVNLRRGVVAVVYQRIIDVKQDSPVTMPVKRRVIDLKNTGRICGRIKLSDHRLSFQGVTCIHDPAEKEILLRY